MGRQDLIVHALGLFRIGAFFRNVDKWNPIVTIRIRNTPLNSMGLCRCVEQQKNPVDRIFRKLFDFLITKHSCHRKQHSLAPNQPTKNQRNSFGRQIWNAMTRGQPRTKPPSIIYCFISTSFLVHQFLINCVRFKRIFILVGSKNLSNSGSIKHALSLENPFLEQLLTKHWIGKAHTNGKNLQLFLHLDSISTSDVHREEDFFFYHRISALLRFWFVVVVCSLT